MYCKVMSTSLSRLEAHSGFFKQTEGWLVGCRLSKSKVRVGSRESFLAKLLSLLSEFNSRKVFIPLFGAGSLAFFKQ